MLWVYKRDHWLGISAWRHRTNQVHLDIGWWHFGLRVWYDNPLYQIVKRLPVSDPQND